MLPQIDTISHPVSRRDYPSLLCGAIAPLFTPERLDGRIDYEGLQSLADHLCRQSAVSALLIRTGEGRMWSYSLEEARQAIQCVLDVARHRKPVIAGTAGIWTGECSDSPRPAVYYRRAVELSEWALASGAAAVLQPVPAFLTGGYDYTPQDRILRFFEDLAQSVNGPIVIYNQEHLPEGHALLPESLARLSQHRQFVGAIYYTHDSSILAELVRCCHPRFSVVSGYDSLAIPAFMGGATSSAGTLATLLPEVIDTAWRSLATPDLSVAWRAQTDLLKIREMLAPYQGPDIGCAVLARQGLHMAPRSRAAGRQPLRIDIERVSREIGHIRAAYG